MYHETLIMNWILDEILMKRNSTYNLTNGLQNFIWSIINALEILLVQFSSVAQSCPTLCNTRNRSTPGLAVHHQLLESTQTHVHGVGDAIQPSHPLLSSSPSALNLSKHQGIFQWVSVFIDVLGFMGLQISVPAGYMKELILFNGEHFWPKQMFFFI